MHNVVLKNDIPPSQARCDIASIPVAHVCDALMCHAGRNNNRLIINRQLSKF